MLTGAGYQTLANGQPFTFNNLALLLGDCCGGPSSTDDVFGCTDPLAQNYYSYATVDDYSCCYTPGCAN